MLNWLHHWDNSGCINWRFYPKYHFWNKKRLICYIETALHAIWYIIFDRNKKKTLSWKFSPTICLFPMTSLREEKICLHNKLSWRSVIVYHKSLPFLIIVVALGWRDLGIIKSTADLKVSEIIQVILSIHQQETGFEVSLPVSYLE